MGWENVLVIGRTITVLAILVLIFQNDVVMHEETHVAIDNLFGYYDSDYKMSFMSGVTTSGKQYYELSEAEQTKRLELHAWNEIVSYNLSTIYMVILVIACVYFLNNKIERKIIREHRRNMPKW